MAKTDGFLLAFRCLGSCVRGLEGWEENEKEEGMHHGLSRATQLPTFNAMKEGTIEGTTTRVRRGNMYIASPEKCITNGLACWRGKVYSYVYLHVSSIEKHRMRREGAHPADIQQFLILYSLYDVDHCN